MRVLFISPFYPPYAVGGAEYSTFALADALVGRGHDVQVLSPRLGPEPTHRSVSIETVDVGLRQHGPGRPISPRTFDRPDIQLRFAIHAARLCSLVDVVHCQTLHLLPAAYLGARRAGVPIVATIRDLGGVCSVAVCLLDAPRVPHDCGLRKLGRTCIPRFNDLYHITTRRRTGVSAVVGFATARARSRLLRRCDAVYSVGADLGRLYAEARLLDAQNIHLLHNVAEPADNLAKRVQDGSAVYAGKVSPGKGAKDLLAAVTKVRRDAPDFRLAVAGRAEEPWRTKLVSTPGVEYHGWLSRTDLRKLYADARFAVVPSTWPEPFPRAALEAASAGVPVVGTRVGGIPEVVRDGVTGVLVEPRDPDALSAAMLRLWSDRELAQKLGAAARLHVETEFGPDRIAARTEELYHDVIKRRSASA